MARRTVFIKCSVIECGNNGHRSGGGARGYCSKHYHRLLKYGDPLAGRTPQNVPMSWLIQHKSFDGNECLAWPFGKARKGYGLICVGGKNTQASRQMCKIAHGEPPSHEYQAAHTCHNGHLGCVNPRHLIWQTPKQNNLSKLRARVGSQSSNAKLSESDVMEMRRDFDRRSSTKTQIARRFGVALSTASLILDRKTWRHVP